MATSSILNIITHTSSQPSMFYSSSCCPSSWMGRGGFPQHSISFSHHLHMNFSFTFSLISHPPHIYFNPPTTFHFIFSSSPHSHYFPTFHFIQMANYIYIRGLQGYWQHTHCSAGRTCQRQIRSPGPEEQPISNTTKPKTLVKESKEEQSSRSTMLEHSAKESKMKLTLVTRTRASWGVEIN